MIFNIGSGKAKSKQPPLFTCTGTPGTDYLYAESAQGDWELAVLTSCSITFQRVGPVDIFLVGGGNPGTNGYYVGGSANDVYGGSGGSGGRRLTKSSVTLVEGTAYAVSIGGSGASTAGFGYSSENGNAGSPGGSGAHAVGVNDKYPATGGNDGAYAFGESTALIENISGRKYGAGGGGAACRNSSYASAYGTHTGGQTGGGAGGGTPDTSSGRNGTDGYANTGSGGGGACRDGAAGATGTPGSGGSGILILRNARGD